ncbi:MAG: hypothetical protein OES46_01345 [Gammaproteobacteria bacterium]|nr:hypothetical protein [Gammaproteobacteria bacterium]
MKALLATLVLAGTLLTVPAYAFHCPADMAKIDAALQAGTKLSATQLAEVQRLRDEGERLHKAGNHGESVKALAEAMDMLGI